MEHLKYEYALYNLHTALAYTIRPPDSVFLLAFGVEESPEYSRGQLSGSLVDQPSRSADPVYLGTEMRGFIVWELRGSTMDYQRNVPPDHSRYDNLTNLVGWPEARISTKLSRPGGPSSQGGCEHPRRTTRRWRNVPPTIYPRRYLITRATGRFAFPPPLS